MKLLCIFNTQKEMYIIGVQSRTLAESKVRGSDPDTYRDGTGRRWHVGGEG
jgi:hypothetical protein